MSTRRGFMKNIQKLTICLCLFFISLTIVCSHSFASGGYGTAKSNVTSNYYTWIVADDIPRWVGATCGTTLTQYTMSAGQYIGFHETYLFAYAEPTSPFDSYYVWGGYKVNYKKGTTSLGSANLSTCSDPLIVDADWVWFYKSGNANGLLGTGYGTYSADTTASFSVEGSISTYTVNNVLSITN